MYVCVGPIGKLHKRLRSVLLERELCVGEPLFLFRLR